MYVNVIRDPPIRISDFGARLKRCPGLPGFPVAREPVDGESDTQPGGWVGGYGFDWPEGAGAWQESAVPGQPGVLPSRPLTPFSMVSAA